MESCGFEGNNLFVDGMANDEERQKRAYENICNKRVYYPVDNRVGFEQSKLLPSSRNVAITQIP